MDASIKESVKASDKEAQYDEKAKKLLGHKIILAYILVNTVEEFQGMNPKDVVKYIEGEPYISTVPIDPGMTNTKERKEESIKETETPEQIRALNTENSELNEGMIRFDIIFYVRMKDGLTQIIVNIEAQKEEQARLRKRQNDLKKTEERIGVLETRNGKIDELMMQEEVYTNSVKCQELAKEKAANEAELEELYEKWEELAE